jgi:hypothetical protein
MTDRGWKRPFEDPIPLPRGRHLVTLEEAAGYIMKLPKAEHEAQECDELVLTCAILGQMIQHVPGRGTPRIRIKRGMYE